MRTFLTAMFIIAISGKQLYAQQVKSEILSPAATSTIFTDDVVKQINLQYPIRRVYNYQDQSGTYYLVLCESIDEIRKDDTHQLTHIPYPILLLKGLEIWHSKVRFLLMIEICFSF